MELWAHGKAALMNAELIMPASLSQKWQETIRDSDSNDLWPRQGDILIAFGIAVLMTVIRLILERVMFTPIAVSFGVVSADVPATSVVPASTVRGKSAEQLELIYQKLKREQPRAKVFDVDNVVEASAAAELRAWLNTRSRADRQIERRKLKLGKFCESSFRAIYYTCIVGYGLYTLLGKQWFKDPAYCWKGFPTEHVLDVHCKYYYLISIAYYMHAAVALVLFEDAKKDFWEMMLHHVVTIALVFNSYLANFWRIGTLILLIHDVSDPFLEIAKLAKYLKLHSAADILFACFAVTFGFCRLYVYPVYAWASVYFSCYEFVVVPNYAPNSYPLWWTVYVALLTSLQVLHIYWFALIASMIVQFVRDGSLKKDARSASDSEGSNKED